MSANFLVQGSLSLMRTLTPQRRLRSSALLMCAWCSIMSCSRHALPASPYLTAQHSSVAQTCWSSSQQFPLAYRSLGGHTVAHPHPAQERLLAVCRSAICSRRLRRSARCAMPSATALRSRLWLLSSELLMLCEHPAVLCF